MRYPRFLIVLFVVLGIIALRPVSADASSADSLDDTLARVDTLTAIADRASGDADLARWGGIVDALDRSTDLDRAEADLLARAVAGLVVAVADAGERTGTIVAPDVEDLLDAVLELATAVDAGAEQASAKAAFLTERAIDVTERVNTAEEQAMQTLAAPEAPAPEAGPVERWRPLVERYFGPTLVEQALSIIDCESNGDPTIRNGRSGAAGLFQFIRGTWATASEQAGFGGASPYEPEANIAAAAWLTRYSLDRGAGAWSHWTCRP